MKQLYSTLSRSQFFLFSLQNQGIRFLGFFICLGMLTNGWAKESERGIKLPGDKPVYTVGNKTARIAASPTIVSLNPTRNKPNVPVNATIGLTFSEAVDASTALYVYGTRTGKRSGVTGGTNTPTTTFAPSKAFKPGELVSVTTTTAAKNAGGEGLSNGHVHTFMAAAGVGPANFIKEFEMNGLATGFINQPRALAAADFDGDGDIDLATTRTTPPSHLAIAQNNGNGTFTEGQRLTITNGGDAMIAADLDGDGDADLALVSGKILSTFLNNGAGTFALKENITLTAASGAAASGITHADFDGDGDLDLALTLKGAGIVVVCKNDGAANFTMTTYSGFIFPYGICAADFDNDGDIDIAFTNSSQPFVSIRLNNGTGTFSVGTSLSINSNSQSIQAADLNGDGFVDLVTADINANAISVALNNKNAQFGVDNGSGVFSKNATVSVGEKPWNIQVADFDGDGDIDLATANQASADFSFTLNDGAGNFAAATTVSCGSDGNQTWALQPADFDGDKDIDLAVINYITNQLQIYLNKVPLGSNTLPTISTIATQNLCVNTATTDLAFTIGDAETLPANLAIAATSDNVTLIPHANIVLAGTGANRTVKITPVINQSGSATITLTVTDAEGATATSTFVVNIVVPQVYSVTGGGAYCGGGSGVVVGLSGSQSGVSYQLLKDNAGAGTPLTGTGSALSFGLQTSAGRYTITAKTTGGCSVTMTGSVDVIMNSLPVLTITHPAAVCAPATVDLTVAAITAGSSGSGTLTYWKDASATQALSSPNAVTTAGTYYLKSTTNAGCFDIKPVKVVVQVAPSVTAGSDETVCATGTAFPLAGFSPAGGTWSGNGVSAAGVFTPNTSLIGTQTLTYTIVQNGCSYSATKKITVSNPPTVNAGNDETICATASPLTLSGFSPAGGTWSGSGVSAGGIFTPNSSLIGTQTLTYSVKQGTCTFTDTKTVIVKAVPTAAAGNDESVCSDSSPITLTGFSPAGGNWSGNGVSASGVFTPNASLIGMQTLTYTIVQNGCSSSDTKLVTVKALPVTKAGTNQTVCVDAGSITLTGFSPAGGTWSGNGVTASGVFTPTAALVGDQTLTYTVSENGCVSSATKIVTVTSGLIVAGTPVDNSDCATPNGSIQLTISGGKTPYTVAWNTGKTTTDLTGLAEGTYTVTVSDQGGCSLTKTFTISDPNAPQPYSVTGGGAYCGGGSGVVVGLSGSQSGVSYQLLKDNAGAGTPLTGTGSALSFGLQTSAGRYTITAKTTGGCSVTMTGSVDVIMNSLPVLTITHPAAVCAPATVDLTVAAITAGSSGSGTLTYWKDASATQALSSPNAVTTAGTYYLKSTTNAGCFDIKPVSVTIGSGVGVTVSAGTDQTVCVGDPAFTLMGFSPAGGIWSGNGVSASGVFTPSASVVGIQTLTYTVNQGSCTQLATKFVTINPIPATPTASANTPAVGETLNLKASLTDPGSAVTFQWTGPDNFTSSEQNPIIPSVTMAKTGKYSVRAMVGGCVSQAGSVDVTITPPVLPDSVVFTMDTVVGEPGSSVLVPVRVKDFRNILATQGSLQWNKNVATFAGVENFGLPGMSLANFGTNQTANGQLSFLWTDAAIQPRTLPDNAVLFAVRFTVLGVTGSSTKVQFSNFPTPAEVVGKGSQIVKAVYKAGQIDVVSLAKLSGVIKSRTGLLLKGVEIGLQGSSPMTTVTTTSDGTFALSAPGGKPYTLVPSKHNDVVTNNGVSTLDLVLIQRHILVMMPLDSPYKLIAADVNHSGTVTGLDIVLIRSLILQNTTHFPGGNLWTFVRSDYSFADPTNPFPYDSVRSYTSALSAGNQDFIGLKLGDVNDSWDQGIARIATLAEVEFRLKDQQALPGEEISVPVKVSQFQNVSGYQFTFNWNPAVLEFLTVENKSLQANYGFSQLAEGKLTTSWQDAYGNSQTLPDDSTAFVLHFRVVGDLGTQSYLRINSALTASEAYDDQLQLLNVVSPERTVQVGEKKPVIPVYDYALYQNQPNPFGDQTTIRFSLPQPEKVALTITNNLGQPVQTFYGEWPTGVHTLDWNGTATAGQPLPAGTYYIQMRAGTFTQTKKMVLVR